MSPGATSVAAPVRLPDLCGELFAFALTLRSAKDPGSAAALRQTIAQMFDRLGRAAREGQVDSGHLDQARYALCALLDEIVFGSRWELKAEWLNQPLQMAYFQDFNAGEQFYKRLEEQRSKKEAREIDLLEVYTNCLLLGFRGKHADLAGMQKVAELVDQLVQEIRAARGFGDRALAPRFQREAALPAQVRRLPVWVVASACGAFVLLLLLVLDAILASKAGPVLAAAAAGGR
ncbi:MAG: type IVB secretion system protein IcmH/DotU [Planctomycetes bacterium]|nr:type IVB secretion system protein IcmH/DotU [Planctomycetota bacterium]